MAFSSSHLELYFSHPRLELSFFWRVFVRIVSIGVCGVLLAAAFTFLFMEERPLRALGVLLLLFFLDYTAHLYQGERSLERVLLKKGSMNLARTLTPQGYRVLERAFDRSSIAQQHFYLETLNRLLEHPTVGHILEARGVGVREFKEKVEELLEESNTHGISIGKQVRLEEVERLVCASFEEALRNAHRYIELDDLFLGVAKVGDDFVDHLFELFALTEYSTSIQKRGPKNMVY